MTKDEQIILRHNQLQDDILPSHAFSLADNLANRQRIIFHWGEEFRTCTDLVDYLVLMLAFQSRKPQGFAIPNRDDIFWTFGAIDRLVERNQLVYQGPVKGDIVVSMASCVE